MSARIELAIQWLYPVSLRPRQWLGQPARLYHLLLLAQPFPTLLWALLSAQNWFDSTLPSSLSQSSCCWVKTIWGKLALWCDQVAYHLRLHLKFVCYLFALLNPFSNLVYYHRNCIRLSNSDMVYILWMSKLKEKISSCYLLFPFHSQVVNEMCQEIKSLALFVLSEMFTSFWKLTGFSG